MNHQGHLAGGRGAAASSALIHGGQEGQELPFVLNSFPSLLPSEGALSGTVDSVVQENLFGCRDALPPLP